MRSRPTCPCEDRLGRLPVQECGEKWGGSARADCSRGGPAPQREPMGLCLSASKCSTDLLDLSENVCIGCLPFFGADPLGCIRCACFFTRDKSVSEKIATKVAKNFSPHIWAESRNEASTGLRPWYPSFLRRNPPKHPPSLSELRRVSLAHSSMDLRPWSSAKADNRPCDNSVKGDDQWRFEVGIEMQGLRSLSQLCLRPGPKKRHRVIRRWPLPSGKG